MKHVVILVELKFTVLVSVFGGYHTALISDTTVVRPVTLDLNKVVASGGNNVILTSGRKATARELSILLLSPRQYVKFGVWRDICETVTSSVVGRADEIKK